MTTNNHHIHNHVTSIGSSNGNVALSTIGAISLQGSLSSTTQLPPPQSTSTGTTYTINGTSHINTGSSWAALTPPTFNNGMYYQGSVSFQDKNGKMHLMDDVLERLEMLEKKLFALTENKEKLEQFPSLKDAYDNYKLVEKMIFGDDDNQR